ncbi:iron-containing alcohol dehydrogenase family protein [Alicyclobacillus dauci]|uniref:Iron-containing alcohol dehydrogenase family protein n=1 Tax=Alicyclobacillus dauci TaxID=1475485 RepID=A0ABY6Z075_9BACL|nr:iron-containing alcohol dehydrogenase family protein [Alicyclobacillus dauci]WAH35766.1 iron-containing alcohol dehydrogenase family protein [Alicyclobacillus dauci]
MSVDIVQGTPNLYLHQPGLLNKAGEHIGRFGKDVLIVTGEESWNAVEPQFTNSLTDNGIAFCIERYRGQCSYEEVGRLCATVKTPTELVIGVGGGKVLDTAKAVAAKVDLPFIAVPTLASTCSPVTPVSVIYTTDGVFLESQVWPKNSLVTLVDTQVVAKSPLNYFLSGVGDTLAKWYESSASSTRNNYHNVPTIAALQMARLCKTTLFQNTEQAIMDLGEWRPSPALQEVVDTIFLVAGMVGGLGGEACRAAAGHAIHNGLTILPQTKGILHGEKVAYGVAVQLVLERKDDELAELLSFYKKCHLPGKLSDMGIDLSQIQETLFTQAIANSLSDASMNFMPMSITESMLRNAIIELELRG